MTSQGARNPRVDAYIANAQPFAQPILRHLRDRFHAACPDAEEYIKWGMPFFGHGSKLIANMAAFTAHASFGFWNRQETAIGEKGDAMGQFGRLTVITDLPADGELDAMIRAQVEQAASPDRSKRAPRVSKPEAAIPTALAEALAGDAVAHAAFLAFAPSHRREYCEWIADAKRDETRARRVAQAVAWLREGKPRNWQYQRD